MKNVLCSLTYESQQRQELFWRWVDQAVRRLVVELAEELLQLQMNAFLKARWNQRSPERLCHPHRRSGHCCYSVRGVRQYRPGHQGRQPI